MIFEHDFHVDKVNKNISQVDKVNNVDKVNKNISQVILDHRN
jgi:hypothetical protein